MFRRLVVLAAAGTVIAVLDPSTAAAQTDRGRSGHAAEGRGNGRGDRPRPRTIPEFDPATAGAIAAVVAGGGVLIARRRKR